jgi:CBS domain-containing protein
MLIAHILRDKGGEVHAVAAATTLCEAARELTARKVGAVMVLDESGALVGVLSERDIVRELSRRGPGVLGEPVSGCMTRNIHVAHPLETVDEALSRMSDRRVRHLPVMEGRRLVGVVSIGDLVARKLAEAEQEAAAMRAYIAAG